jgi:hypothetical protein
MKYDQRAIMLRPNVHKVVQICARYFSCTQSELIELLLKFAFLMETDNLKESSVKRFKDHLDYFLTHQELRAGLKEMLNMINEGK